MAAEFRNPSREEGFTLLEVIVAISILTVGLLAVASMLGFAIRGNSLARDVTQANSWAVDRIEKLLLSSYNDPDLLRDTDGDGIDGLNDDTVATADHNDTQGIYSIFWNIAVNEPRNNTKTIKVIARWTERGVQKDISLDFIKANI